MVKSGKIFNLKNETENGQNQTVCSSGFNLGHPVVYMEAIELSSWLYWVLLAEWMMLKAFSQKWEEERNAKKNSFAQLPLLPFFPSKAF